MPNPNNNVQAPSNYNPRWFIWTIVFLVVSGISLVSYILLSGNFNDYQDDFYMHRVVKAK